MYSSTEPLVSVIIPTYNHAHYLDCALESVLNQTYMNWEAIVIDNHSTDETAEVIKRFSDSRIISLKIHNNGVIAASRNAGIYMAKGEWIAFLDSDDWWANDKLQACVENIDDKVDLIYHYLEIASSKPRFFRGSAIKSRQVRAPVLIDLLVNGNDILNSSVMVRKNLLTKIGGIDERGEIIASEDYCAWLYIAKLTNQFVCLQYNLGYYRVHDSNTSSISRKDMSESDRIVTAEFMDLLNCQQKIKIEARLSYTRGRFNYFKGNYKEARENLFFALLHHAKFLFKVKAFISLVLLEIKALPDRFSSFKRYL